MNLSKFSREKKSQSEPEKTLNPSTEELNQEKSKNKESEQNEKKQRDKFHKLEGQKEEEKLDPSIKYETSQENGQEKIPVGKLAGLLQIVLKQRTKMIEEGEAILRGLPTELDENVTQTMDMYATYIVRALEILKL